jgi:hypothetical protein
MLRRRGRVWRGSSTKRSARPRKEGWKLEETEEFVR